jgi:hypothetical protein
MDLQLYIEQRAHRRQAKPIVTDARSYEKRCITNTVSSDCALRRVLQKEYYNYHYCTLRRVCNS